MGFFGIQQAVTIGVAAQGELLTEKSGILNIGIQGVLVLSAFAGAIVDGATEATLGPYSPVAGLVAGMVTGMTANFLFSGMSAKLHVDQVIAGIGINIFALGISYVILKLNYSLDGTNIANTLKPLAVFRGAGGKVSISVSWLDVVLFLLPVLTYLVLAKTRFGLHVRAVGENPRAAEAAGVSVAGTRILATTAGGALIGLAGAYLTCDLFNQFFPSLLTGLTGGVGFIALAAVIAGAWKPGYVLGISLVFGVSIGAYVVSQTTTPLGQLLLSVLPFIVTIVVLAVASKRLRPPSALAVPYKKE